MKVALVGAELEENLALRYLHASLTQAGHEAVVLDFHAPGQVPAVAAEIAARQPDLVGMSMVFTARAGEFIALARRLRAAGYRGHVTAGGHFATFHARELLAAGGAFDSIVHGEGEEPLVELADSLDRPQRVPGLSWRDADGHVKFTGDRGNPRELDARPWPTRPDTFHEYLGLPIANVLAGRGCYGTCSFCSIHAWHRAVGGPRFRQRAAACVAEEMAHLYWDRGVRIFNFHDDNFFLPTKAASLDRFEQLREHLRRRGVGRIGIQVKARPDSVDPEVMALLKRIGLFRVFLGVETAAAAGLKMLHRGITRRQNVRALGVLRRLGLHACFNLLMFDPYTRPEDLRQNIAFMRRQARWPLNFCRVEIYAGTELQRQLRAEGRLEGSYLGYSYRILDPRVQLAYEVFRDVFTPRNFVAEGLNHQAMKIDYYLHLLAHFYPASAGRPLVRRVKGLVAELNRNSADLLDAICRFAEGPSMPAGADVAAFTARMADARAEADRDLGPRMEAALADIRRLAESPPQRHRGRWAKAAAAATAALMTAGCGPSAAQDTHMHERAPAPLEPVKIPPGPLDTHPCEMAPGPIGPPPAAVPKPEMLPAPALQRALTPEELANVQKQIGADHGKALEQMVQKHLQEGERADLPEIELILAPGGHVVLCVVRWPAGRHAEFQKALTAAASQWAFPVVARGGHGTIALGPIAAQAPPLDAETAARVEKEVHKAYGDKLLELAVRQLPAERRTKPVQVKLVLDAQGNVVRYDILLDEKEHPAYQQALGKLIGTWRFPLVTKPGTCTVSLDVLKTIQPKFKPPDIHMFEMVPRPIDPPKLPKS